MYAGVFDVKSKDDDAPLTNRLYMIKRADGAVFFGRTDDEGKTNAFHTYGEEKIQIHIDPMEKMTRDKTTDDDVSDWFNS
jgi:hypothetical protein